MSSQVVSPRFGFKRVPSLTTCFRQRDLLPHAMGLTSRAVRKQQSKPATPLKRGTPNPRSKKGTKTSNSSALNGRSGKVYKSADFITSDQEEEEEEEEGVVSESEKEEAIEVDPTPDAKENEGESEVEDEIVSGSE